MGEKVDFSDKKEDLDIPMKIPSDTSILDQNLLGCGLGKNVYTFDIREKKNSHN